MKQLTTIFLLLFAGATLLQGQSDFVVNGSATEIDGCFQLTTTVNAQVGSIWNEQLIDLNESFEVAVELFFGNKDVDGADGMVFGLQPISTTLAGNGGTLGFDNVQPSLGVEFDNFQNLDFGDPVFDHITIIRDGVLNHNLPEGVLAGPIQTNANNPNVEDGTFYPIQISWDAVNQQLSVYLDCELRLTYMGDIVNDIFDGDPMVFWGFTGATGGLNNDQRVCLSYTTLLDGLADQTICLGETVQLEASGGVSYQWQANETLSATDIPDPIATPTETTLYTVQITDDCGRTFTDDVLITIEEFAFDVSLEGTIDEDDEVVQCQEFTLSAVVNPPPSDSVAYTYEWSFTTGLGSTISSSTDSTVTIMASATQTGTETIQVMVTPVSDCGGSPRTEAFTFEVVLPDYRVPNVFTPNNDNQNDGFGIVTNGKLENYTCKIYNRWGALVFETNEAADLWDGTFNSQDSPVGVYVYHINFRIDEQEFVEVGDVTLLR